MSSGKDKKPQKSDEQKQTKGISIRRFVITYFVLMGGFFFIIGFTPFQKIIDLNGLYTNGVVAATAGLLRLLSIPCTFEGSLIRLPSILLDVKFGCNGLEAVMIYSVAVIAYPSPLRDKLKGIAAGFAVIQIVNILRIAALAYSGVHFRRFFDYIHVYVAQGLMIAVALGVFFIYLNYLQRRIITGE